MSAPSFTVTMRPRWRVIRPSDTAKAAALPQARVVATFGMPGAQGPPGEAGAAASYDIIQTSAAPLSALRAVRSTGDGVVDYCDAATAAHARSFLGVTVTSGLQTTVRSAGELDGFLGLSPGAPVYVGDGGAITQTPPASGFVLRIGFARSATKIFIDPSPPIYR